MAGRDLSRSWRSKFLLIGALLALCIAAAVWNEFYRPRPPKPGNRQPIPHCQLVLLREGQSPYARVYERAARLMQQGDAAGAEKIYRRRIGLEPGAAHAHVGLGIALSMQGNWREAREAYRKAHELDPAMVSPLIGLGGAALRAGDAADAEMWYQKAFEAAPDNPYAHYGLGYAHAIQGNTPKAAHHYRRYLELEPDAPLAPHARKALANLPGAPQAGGG